MQDQGLATEQLAIARLLLQGLSYRAIGSQLHRTRQKIKRVAKLIHTRLSLLDTVQRHDGGLEPLYNFLTSRFGTLPAKGLAPTPQFTSTTPAVTVTSRARPFAKIRINELAREIEVKPNAILDFLPEIGVTQKKTHSSSLDNETADRIRRKFTGKPDEDLTDENSATERQDEYVGLALVEGKFRLVRYAP